MAKKTRTEVDVPEQKVEGKAEATSPMSLIEQIETLQKELRKVREEKAVHHERQQNLESELSRLLAESSLERKKEDFLKGLNEHERGLLKDRKPS